MLHNDKDLLKKLFSAISNNKADQVEHYLKEGVDTNGINSAGKTPLEVVVEDQRWVLAKLIIKYTKEKIPANILQKAIIYAPDLAKFIIEKGCDIEGSYNEWGEYPLHTAIKYKRISLVKMLLEHKANPLLETVITDNNSEETPSLLLALKNNLSNVVKLLLDALDRQNIEPFLDNILQSLYGEYWNSYEQFIIHPKYQFSPPIYDKLLSYAVRSRRNDMVKLLIEKKASPDNICLNDETPLHIAVEKMDSAIVNTLLEAKANPAVKNALLQTSFDIALDIKNRDIIQLLFKKTGLKDKKMKEFFSDNVSFRQTLENVGSCLDKYLFNIKDILYYIEQQKENSNNDVIILALLLNLAIKNKNPILSMFKDIQQEGHRYVAQSIIEIIIKLGDSSQYFYESIPEVLRNLFTSSEKESKHHQSYSTSHMLTNLLLLKNKYIKQMRDRISDMQYLNFDKKIIHRIAAMNNIQDQLKSPSYNFQTMESKLKIIYGEDIFYGGLFDRNPLQSIVLDIVSSISRQNKTQSGKGKYKHISEKQGHNPPPEFNPDFQEEEPGSQNNSYLENHFFKKSTNEMEKQIEGQPSMKMPS